MVIPLHSNTLHSIPEGIIQPEEMKREMPESGVYHYPGMPESNDPALIEEVEHKLQAGPRITLLVYKNSPTTLFNGIDFAWGLVINLLTTILAFVIVSRLNAKSFRSVMLVSLSIGLVTALLSDISMMNWFMFPVDYTFASALDKIVSFALLGLLFSGYSFKGKEAY